MMCTACNGLGTYEYWGTVYRCEVCGGRGDDGEPEDWEDYYEEETGEPEEDSPEIRNKEVHYADPNHH